MTDQRTLDQRNALYTTAQRLVGWLDALDPFGDGGPVAAAAVVAAMDNVCQAKAIEHDEAPVGSPVRLECAVRVAEMQRAMDRYIARHT